MYYIYIPTCYSLNEIISRYEYLSTCNNNNNKINNIKNAQNLECVEVTVTQRNMLIHKMRLVVIDLFLAVG